MSLTTFTKKTNNLDHVKKSSDILSILSKIIILFVLVAIIVFFTVVSPNFMTLANFINIFKQVSVNGIIAIGMTFVILSGGIDLSVGSIVAFAGVVAASIAQSNNGNWWLAIFAALGVGLALGLINGILVARFNVVPFIQTLAMMSIARGLTMIYSNGQPISGLNQAFTSIGTGDICKIPYIVIIFVVVFLIALFYLYRTKQGKYIYAIGGNDKAAYISGIKVRVIKVSVYVISGLLCGIAAVVLTARTASGLPTAATGYEMNGIAAVVIGGTSLFGGTGSLFGTFIGILIIGVLNNGLDLINVNTYIQSIITGIIIIAAVMLDRSMSKD